MKAKFLPLLLTRRESLGRPLGLSLFLRPQGRDDDSGGGDICSASPQNFEDAQVGKWI